MFTIVIFAVGVKSPLSQASFPPANFSMTISSRRESRRKPNQGRKLRLSPHLLSGQLMSSAFLSLSAFFVSLLWSINRDGQDSGQVLSR